MILGGSDPSTTVLFQGCSIVISAAPAAQQVTRGCVEAFGCPASEYGQVAVLRSRLLSVRGLADCNLADCGLADCNLADCANAQAL